MRAVFLFLLMTTAFGAQSQNYKDWMSTDTTWHILEYTESEVSPDSAEYWAVEYVNPEDDLERVFMERYINGSLRKYSAYQNYGTELESGIARFYYPGENSADIGQMRHARVIYNQQFDDTLQSWWPNGAPRTLEVYDRGKRISGKSFNERGEEIDYVPYERFPEFPGGDQALMRYLGNNITYPRKLGRRKITGMVLSTFTVNQDGSISNVEILESPHNLFSDEVIRLVNSMPAWIPGSQDGRTVSVQYRLPIRFSQP